LWDFELLRFESDLQQHNIGIKNHFKALGFEYDLKNGIGIEFDKVI
jgi:hypothetical protein